jgi:hypothetical protein
MRERGVPGKTIKNIGPKSAAPPIPDEIAHVETRIQVGSINQYFVRSRSDSKADTAVLSDDRSIEPSA